MASERTESCFCLIWTDSLLSHAKETQTVEQWQPNDGKKENRENSPRGKGAGHYFRGSFFSTGVHVGKT